MQRPDGMQKPGRKKAKAARSSQGEVSAKYFPAPTAPGQSTCVTALSPNPCYSDELFGRYPPPEGWTAEDVSVVKDEYRGIRMLRPSPTMQLRDWGVDSYEEFCIQEAYYLP